MADFLRWLFRLPDTTDSADCVARGLVWGGILGIALIVSVFAFGQTFGQRCAVAFDKGGADWSECVRRLSEGGQVDE